MKRKQIFENNLGQAALVVVLVVFSVVTVIVTSVGLITYREIKTTGNTEFSAQSYYSAEAVAEDALERVALGKKYTNNYSLTLNGGTGSVVIDTTGGTVTATGLVNSRQKKIQVGLITTSSSGYNFNNKLIQTGYGGIKSQNSYFSGNIVSSGPIDGVLTSKTTGDVYSMSWAATSNQTNNPPCTGTPFLTIGKTQLDLAQSFTLGSTTVPKSLQVYIDKLPSSGSTVKSLNVYIVNDSGGHPGTNILASGFLANTTVGTSFAWKEIENSSGSGGVLGFGYVSKLTAGTTYWLVFDNLASSLDATNYYNVGSTIGTSYASGNAQVGQYGVAGSWSAAADSASNNPSDACFQLTTGSTGSIKNIGVTGNIHANTLVEQVPSSQNVSGARHCVTGPSCVPPDDSGAPQDPPISQADIDAFKASADAGTVETPPSGIHDVTLAGETFNGPREIIGDLRVSVGVLTLKGPLHVTGNLTVLNGAINLDSSYGASSEVIVVDGTVGVSAGGVNGSGTNGSYLVLIGTLPASAGWAVSINNCFYCPLNYTTIVYAPYGRVLVSGLAAQISAYFLQINISSSLFGTTMLYNSGLNNVTLKKGFKVGTWKEIP